jgi:hypothetical protein
MLVHLLEELVIDPVIYSNANQDGPGTSNESFIEQVRQVAFDSLHVWSLPLSITALDPSMS